MNLIFLIPITAIVMSLGIAMLHIWTEHKRKSQILEQLHRERLAAIEKGIELPPMNLDSNGMANSAATAVPNPAKVLRSGVFMLALGIVLYFALDAAGAAQSAIFGLIPATLGLANLAYAAVLFNKEGKEGGDKARTRLPEI